ncbi:MAG: AMP-binding protein [bacterium]|nr:AMP-binding protein [bacterium]
MLLQDFLTESTERFPDKVAVIFRGQRFTYGELERQANRLAWALLDLGVKRGERVAVFLDNSLESVIALFGILKAGAVFVILSAAAKAAKVEYILSHCGARVLISHGNKHEVLRDLKLPGLVKIMIGEDEAGQSPPDVSWSQVMTAGEADHCPPRRNIDLDLAALIYTSGSTADPKGVMLTHLNMVSAATSIISYLKNTPDDIIMNVLPLSFDYGLYQVLMAVKFGGTVVLEKSFVYPYAVIDKMIRERVSGFPLVPTIAAILLQLESLKNYTFSSLRYITNTGAALPESHIRKLRDLFPQVAIYSMYGLTECKRVSYLPPEELDRRPNSVGKPMPNVEAFIVDEQGNEIDEPGRIGELVVRGSNVMRGYWQDPEETARVLRPGRYPGEVVLYTGDYFKMDEEGYLFFVGRKDDLIKTRGERVSPREVENVLHQIDGVLEAVVIGVPDDLLGQAVKAFIMLQEGKILSEKEIIAYCMDKLEFFMVPKFVEFLTEFPKTATGKIDRRAMAMREERLNGLFANKV